MIAHVPFYQVLDRLEGFIRKNDALFFEWFVGISDQPEKALFEEHRINRNADVWFYQELPSTTEARRILHYFLNQGCRGTEFKGSLKNACIYAYRRSKRTNP